MALGSGEVFTHILVRGCLTPFALRRSKELERSVLYVLIYGFSAKKYTSTSSLSS